MRYILDSSGYIESVSCSHIECNNKGCTQYTGSVPSGYSSLQEWATTANIRAYKISSGNLVYDATRAAELEAELNNGYKAVMGKTKKNLASNYYASGVLAAYQDQLYIEMELQPDTTYTLSFEGNAGTYLYFNERLLAKGNYFYVSTGTTVLTFTTQSTLDTTQYKLGKGWLILKNGKDLTATPVFNNLVVENDGCLIAGKNYSLSEYIVGTWVDGRPLYQKTIDCGTLKNDNTSTINHKIANIRYIVGVEGVMYNSSGIATPLPYIDNNTLSNSVKVSTSREDIWIETGSDRTAYTAFITLRYTKND